MAADVPDAHALKSWQEAFQYPIPTVRRIEHELRRDIVSNKEKLRSLVGVRYRDLLDTAQTIMEMNEEMKQVERNLSEVGRLCNPATISRKSDGLHKLREDNLCKVSSDRTFAAQLTLLFNCASAIARILREHGSSVVAAKLLVISRLLHNRLSQCARATSFADELRNQLAHFRRTLLNRIKVRLASIDSSVQDIIEALSAFCLATSSSTHDAFGHFHKIRLDAIASKFEQPGAICDAALGALMLFSNTLHRTTDMLSGPLFDAIKKLCIHPLLGDSAIQCMSELGIEMVQSYIPKEIRNFTPWIKHEQIPKEAAGTIIKSWSKEAFDDLSARANSKLSSCENFQEVLSTRNRLLKEWLPGLNSTPCHNPMGILEAIRTMANDQLISIIRAQSEGITVVGIEASRIISDWHDTQDQDRELSLWDSELVFADFSDGATTFKRELMRRCQGHGAHVGQVLDIYRSWLATVTNRCTMVQELRSLRWEDMMEDDVDEELLEAIPDLLNTDDPHLLITEHTNALIKGYKLLETSLEEAVKGISGSHCAMKTAFLLRIIRGIRSNVPKEVAHQDYIFAQDLISRLHSALAEEVVSRTSPSILTKSINRLGSRCAGRTLWEGNPSLPTQPSQVLFMLLRTLVMEMEQEGPDLWTMAAVDELKSRFMGQVVSANNPKLEQPPTCGGTEQDSPNGTEEGAEENQDKRLENTRDHQIQLLFDLQFLDQALQTTDSNTQSGLSPLIDVLLKELDFSEESMVTVKKRSEEYWNRTRMLFGLLA
ncbi:predicted protein [Uncinocarpus reesii 1704]|uniref:Conserved oligomeric Golgi complex subunit 1 n=1 Tax=Uncinocarpus reesii (strain UAMH 1704) TaxID=336963 RepID=C4JR37_UNCRE|nr:uncharacterized protein UREG_03519 [Uncinocarpus reesii 1704]EEP78673.1 predicted protein [Uncinocarpus reesii 1704]